MLSALLSMAMSRFMDRAKEKKNDVFSRKRSHICKVAPAFRVLPSKSSFFFQRSKSRGFYGQANILYGLIKTKKNRVYF
jgi:hypothetical protein